MFSSSIFISVTLLKINTLNSLECLYQLSIVEYYPNFKMPAYSSRWIFIVSGHDFDLARAIFKMRLSRGFSVEEFGLFGG